jgi:hypothetical protein
MLAPKKWAGHLTRRASQVTLEIVCSEWSSDLTRRRRLLDPSAPENRLAREPTPPLRAVSPLVADTRRKGVAGLFVGNGRQASASEDRGGLLVQQLPHYWRRGNKEECVRAISPDSLLRPLQL